MYGTKKSVERDLNYILSTTKEKTELKYMSPDMNIESLDFDNMEFICIGSKNIEKYAECFKKDIKN